MMKHHDDRCQCFIASWKLEFCTYRRDIASPYRIVSIYFSFSQCTFAVVDAVAAATVVAFAVTVAGTDHSRVRYWYLWCHFYHIPITCSFYFENKNLIDSILFTLQTFSWRICSEWWASIKLVSVPFWFPFMSAEELYFLIYIFSPFFLRKEMRKENKNGDSPVQTKSATLDGGFLFSIVSLYLFSISILIVMWSVFNVFLF